MTDSTDLKSQGGIGVTMHRVRPEVRDLANMCNLVEIRPTVIEARLVSGAPAPGGHVDMKMELDQKVETAKGGFAILTTADVAVRPTGEETPFALFKYALVARYLIATPLPGEDVVLEFGRTNGIIHAWPYIRAHLTSCAGQMGIPQFVLPPFRVTAGPVAPKPPSPSESSG